MCSSDLAETIVEVSGAVVTTRPQELWQELSRFHVFATFTEQQRTSFIDACQHDAGMCVRRFAEGQLICKKGEYELDLCFVLRGKVDLFDVAADGSRIRAASIPAGAFFGELGALGGLARTTDVVAAEQGAELFYLPRHCLKFLISNAEARQIVTDRYHDRAVRVLAQELDRKSVV